MSDAAAPLALLFVVARYPPEHEAGAEMHCRDVARDLARRGHSVTVLTSRKGRSSAREERDGVTVVRTLRLIRGDRPGVWVSGSDCRRLRREIRRSRAQVVVYSHLDGVTGALLGVRRDRPVVYDVSSGWLRAAASPSDTWFRRWERQPKGALSRLWQSICRGIASTLVGVPVSRPKLPDGPSYFWSRRRWMRYLADGLPVQDATLLVPGVELRHFRFAPREMDDTVTVLFLGDISRARGLHCAVLALGDLPANVRLRAVGEVKDENYIAEVAELGRAMSVMDRIEISPPISLSELPGLYTDADVFVYLSEERETFPRPLLEAFACGTPVVGTTVEGLEDILIEGETGLTIPPGNARELGRQLVRLIEDGTLRKNLQKKARKLVERRFALGYTVDQIETLLREAASAPSSAAGGHA